MKIESFAAVLANQAQRAGDQLAFLYLRDGESDEERWTYGDLDRRSRAIAGSLRERVPRGGRVLLLLPPGLDYNAAVYACFYAAAVGVSAAPPHPKRLQRTLPRLLAIAENAEIDAVLTTGAIRDAALPFLSEGPLARAEWLLADGELGPAEELSPPRVRGEEMAFLQYTSGSTREPRGVMLTYDCLLDNTEYILRRFGADESTVGYDWLPPYHDMGLIGGIIQPVYVGCPCIFTSPISIVAKPARWLQGMTRYGANSTGGPNFAYDLCVNRIGEEECEGLDLSEVRLAFNGAEPIRAATMDAFAEKFGPYGFRREAFLACYGLAEATLLVSSGPLEEAPLSRGFDAAALERHAAEPPVEGAPAVTLVSCGRADTDHPALIVDPETGTPCPPGRVGEIWVGGPSLAAGYWGREEETAATFGARLAGDPDAAYLRSGDLGTIVDGELYVTGRIKELLIVNGRNLHPHDLEEAAEAAHPSVRPHASAAFAVEGDGGVEVTMAVEIDAVDPGEHDEVLAAVRQRVARDVDVQLFELVLCGRGEVPKTTSGKIQRGSCGQLLEAGELEVLARWSRAEGVPS
jgi:acyl-CoA synthetase (AMP-forming)/AMP-acid ligase II